jgi:hypothetical protein
MRENGVSGRAVNLMESMENNNSDSRVLSTLRRPKTRPTNLFTWDKATHSKLWGTLCLHFDGEYGE